MVIERHATEARRARLDEMIAEFRAARQRRRAKRGIALWNRTELTVGQAAARAEPPLPPTKAN